MKRIYFLLVLFLAGTHLSYGGPGTVTAQQKIADGVGNLPNNTLANNDFFGGACAPLGDLDGDGVPDFAVGAFEDDFANGGGSGTNNGAVYILFMNGDGTVKSRSKIADGFAGLPNGTIPDSAFFGTSCASLGDLDGDGVTDLAVGARNALFPNPGGGTNYGMVFLLFLNTDGTVKTHRKIANGFAGLGNNVYDDNDFGDSCSLVGDLDGDGVPELAVGASFDDTQSGGGGSANGAVYIFFLRANGTVKSHVKIADGESDLPGGTLASGDRFGSSCAGVGDVDWDGVPDLAVGAEKDNTASGGGGDENGAIYLLFLNADGTVKSHTKIADGEGGLAGGTIANVDRFGGSCAPIGDLDWDGIPDLAVGAHRDDTLAGASTGMTERHGAVYILFLNADGTVKGHTKIADGLNGLASGTLGEDASSFGSSCSMIGDLDGDGTVEFAVGSILDDTAAGVGDAGSGRGAVYVLTLGNPPIEVTTEVDEIENPGTGVSLREAIQLANASGDFRRIEFSPSLDGATINLGGNAFGLVDQDLVISAERLDNGITLSGEDSSRLFQVDADSSLALACLTLRDGLADAGTSPQNQGGAIQNRGGLYLVDCRVHESSATGAGGGINSTSTGILRMKNCTVDSNEAAGGGGIYDEGVSWLMNCTVTGNEAAGNGGGLLRTGTEMTSFTHTTIAGNSATLEGGGVGIGDAGSSTFSFRNCIVAENTATNGRDDILSGSAMHSVFGKNLIGSHESAETEFPVSALVGTAIAPISADLRSLGDYGGKTPTMPPEVSSLALDAGQFSPLPDMDQRGCRKTSLE